MEVKLPPEAVFGAISGLTGVPEGVIIQCLALAWY